MSARKIISTVLALSLVLTVCSCSKDSSDDETTGADTPDVAIDKDAVIENAGNIADALLVCDGDFLLEHSTGVNDEEYFNREMDYLVSDRAFAYVVDSMSYTVNEDSATGDSVSVSFTLIDYMDVFNSHYHEDVSEVLEDLQGITDTVSGDVMFTFDVVDGEIVLTNLDDVLASVYSFSDPGYILTTDLHGDA